MDTKRNSIITDDLETCYLCGRRATEIHHCLHGTANRKLAEKYDLVVGLCNDCHRQLHDKGRSDLFLEIAAQDAYEKKMGNRLSFIAIFGKSYL